MSVAVAIGEKQFRASGGGRSQNQKLIEIFQARPNEWLEMTWLGHQIAAWQVHSRVAYLRGTYGMKIECEVERDDVTGKRLSQYRYTPTEGVRRDAAATLPEKETHG